MFMGIGMKCYYVCGLDEYFWEWCCFLSSFVGGFFIVVGGMGWLMSFVVVWWLVSD